MPTIAEILKNSDPAIDTAPRARIRRLMDECVGSDLSSWEKNEFFPSIINRFVLTVNQDKCLLGIERRVFGEE